MKERSAFAQDEQPRFAFFICAANGVAQAYGDEPERFWPTQLGALTRAQMLDDSAERSTGLLAEHADRLLIVRNMRYPNAPPGDTHAAGHTMCLTGLTPEGASQNATSTGPSADWFIAQAYDTEPLVLYAGAKSGYIDDRLSFRAPGQIVAGEPDPYQTYLKLTGLLDKNAGTPTAAAQELYDRRKSVNDLVRAEMMELLADSRLSRADRSRLDRHFTAIRDIEVNIQNASCDPGKLDVEEMMSIGPTGYIEDVARLQMQLVGIAFSCNLNRVATLQWGDAGGDATQYEIDNETYERFHWISHRVNSDSGAGTPIADAAEKHAKIDRVRMGTFNAMLDQFDGLSTPQGDLFDSAFAMWTTDVGVGPVGSFTKLPVIIAGSPGGSLKQGQYIDPGQFMNASLLKALIEASGVDSSKFAESQAAPVLDSVFS